MRRNLRVDPSPRDADSGWEEVGLDLKVAQPVVRSTGTKHDLPLITPEEMRRKARLQKSMARKKKGSKNRKARQALVRFEAKLRRRHQDALHKVTTLIALSYRLVVVEDLKVKNMATDGPAGEAATLKQEMDSFLAEIRAA